MHVITIDEKDNEFKREQGRVYGRVWHEKKEGKNDVIVL